CRVARVRRSPFPPERLRTKPDRTAEIPLARALTEPVPTPTRGRREKPACFFPGPGSTAAIRNRQSGQTPRQDRRQGCFLVPAIPAHSPGVVPTVAER